MLSAIVLAAGMARRFGSAKTLALYDAKPLVRHVVERLAIPQIHEIVVVVAGLQEHARALATTSARLVVNKQSSEGMSTSLRLGLASIDPRTQAVLVALADQPTIERAVVEQVIDTWRRTNAAIVAPVYRGVRGHPVLFAATIFDELRALEGDRGARGVIERDARRVFLIPIDGPAPRDVDRPEDLQQL